MLNVQNAIDDQSSVEHKIFYKNWNSSATVFAATENSIHREKQMVFVTE